MASQGESAGLERLEARLGHAFQDRELLRTALTHRSMAPELGSTGHYERLEFLGDAVVGLVAADWLYRSRPTAPEGEMARLKSFLVSTPSLAHLARDLELGELLLMSPGEESTGGREKPSLLADAFESVMAALYLDGGLDAARSAIEPLLVRAIGRKKVLADQDAKTRLQEVLQGQGRALPEYRVLESQGPDHARTFVVECRIDGEPAGRGEGRSKKQAQRRAAAAALETLSPG